MAANARRPDVEMFDLAVVAAAPWKNNRGLTRVVTTEDLDGEVLWRVSVADISRDGPFSIFPGIDRHSALLEGEQLELLGADHCMAFAAPGEIHAYPGEAQLSSRLREGAGGARLINVMTTRGLADCRMRRHVGEPVEFHDSRGALLVTAGTFGLFQGNDYLTQVHAQQGLVVRQPAAGLRLQPNGAGSTLISMRIDLHFDR